MTPVPPPPDLEATLQAILQPLLGLNAWPQGGVDAFKDVAEWTSVQQVELAFLLEEAFPDLSLSPAQVARLVSFSEVRALLR